MLVGPPRLELLELLVVDAGKSRRVWLWTTVGMLFNVPGMLVVAALPVHLLAPEPAAAAVPLGTPEQSTHAIAV